MRRLFFLSGLLLFAGCGGGVAVQNHWLPPLKSETGNLQKPAQGKAPENKRAYLVAG